MADIKSIPALFGAAGMIVLLILIIPRLYYSRSIKLLLVLTAMQLFYLVCEFFLINAPSPQVAIIWNKLIYIPVIILPAAVFHIALIAPGRIKINTSCEVILYLLPILFLCILPGDLIVSGVKKYHWGYGKIEGPAFNSLRLYMAIFSIGSLIILGVKYRNVGSAKTRSYLLYLLLASSIPIGTTVIITFILQPLFNIHLFNVMVHPISFISFAGIMCYAMIRHRVFDVVFYFRRDKFIFIQELERIKESILDHAALDVVLEKLSRHLGCHVNFTASNLVFNSDISGRKEQSLQKDLRRISDNPLSGDHTITANPRDRKKNRQVYDVLQKYDFDIIAPIAAQGDVVGFIKFGKGLFDYIYSKRDIKQMSVISEKIKNLLHFLTQYRDQDRWVSTTPITIVAKSTDAIYDVITRTPQLAYIINCGSKKEDQKILKINTRQYVPNCTGK